MMILPMTTCQQSCHAMVSVVYGMGKLHARCEVRWPCHATWLDSQHMIDSRALSRKADYRQFFGLLVG